MKGFSSCCVTAEKQLEAKYMASARSTEAVTVTVEMVGVQRIVTACGAARAHKGKVETGFNGTAEDLGWWRHSRVSSKRYIDSGQWLG